MAMLSCLGAYAVRARAVASRTREIGVRLALGSTQGAVVRLALGQGMRLAAIGLTIGLGASVLLGSVIRQWLFDTRPTDPIVIASAVAALGGAAALASWIPARRAAAVDPLTALREG